MEEEEKKEADLVDDGEREASPSEKKIDIPQMETVIDDPETEAEMNSPVPQMIQYLKSHAGFTHCSASRIERLPKDSKHMSKICGQLITTYLMKGGKDQEEFKKAYCNGDLVLIQVHQGMPTMCEDGAYNSVDINGNPIKSILVGTFMLTSPKADFKPFIVMRTGPCSPSELGEKPGTLGMLIGDPYHQTTDAETAAVIKETQPQAAATESAPTV